MTFTLATGLVLGTADSYVSVDKADIYHESLENTAWASVADEKKEWLLRRASTMINARYAWDDVSAWVTVPRAVEIATAELAFYHLTTPTVESETLKQISVGPIGITYETATQATQPGVLRGVWGFIDMILGGLGSSTVATTAGNVWRQVAISRS